MPFALCLLLADPVEYLRGPSAETNPAGPSSSFVRTMDPLRGSQVHVGGIALASVVQLSPTQQSQSFPLLMEKLRRWWWMGGAPVLSKRKATLNAPPLRWTLDVVRGFSSRDRRSRSRPQRHHEWTVARAKKAVLEFCHRGRARGESCAGRLEVRGFLLVVPKQAERNLEAAGACFHI